VVRAVIVGNPESSEQEKKTKKIYQKRGGRKRKKEKGWQWGGQSPTGGKVGGRNGFQC